jgi:tetratricopeptide (TPR) repeat protein
MYLSDLKDLVSNLYHPIFTGLRLLGVVLVLMSLGCTTTAPNPDQKSGVEGQPAEVDPDQLLLKTLAGDNQALTKSVFVSLSKDAKGLDSWEKSDGWVHLYQGQLTKALAAFENEIQSDQKDMASQAEVGRVRTLLELSLSYQHIVEINQHLIMGWLSYERGRPNSSVHAKWYDVIELLHLQGLPLKTAQQTNRQDELINNLSVDAEMKDWSMFLVRGEQVSPSTPKIKSSYRRWMTFAKAVESSDLNLAQKKMRKLKTSGLILISKGEGQSPNLEVYDPRIPNVLARYYAKRALQICDSIEFGSFYCGRAYELLGDQDKARSKFKASLTQLDALLKQSYQHHIKHVLITAHTAMNGFKDEISHRLTILERPEGKPVNVTSDPPLDITTSALVWGCLSTPQAQSLPSIFPERRRALGILYSQALEKAQGSQKNYVASLGLSDRWLDELHYLYAVELVKRDRRVRALKVLNAAEEAKAGSRLQGRNRLPRLLLSAYNQLKMGRHRVSAKYFQRLKENLPALSFVLVMTSDILSGKSFDSNGSRANAGQ